MARFFQLISFIALLTSTSQSVAQSQQDTLRVESGFWSNSFYQGNKQISEEEFVAFLNSSEESRRLYDQADWLSLLNSGIGHTAGAFVGFATARYLNTSELPVVPFSVGLSLLAISFPLEYVVNRKMNKAVGIYNASLRRTSQRSMQLNWGLSANGIGLQLRF